MVDYGKTTTDSINQWIFLCIELMRMNYFLFIADSVEPLCVFHVLGQLDDTYQKRSGKQRRQPQVALQFQLLIIVAVALNWNKIQTKLNCKSQIFVPFFFFNNRVAHIFTWDRSKGKKGIVTYQEMEPDSEYCFLPTWYYQKST